MAFCSISIFAFIILTFFGNLFPSSVSFCVIGFLHHCNIQYKITSDDKYCLFLLLHLVFLIINKSSIIVDSNPSSNIYSALSTCFRSTVSLCLNDIMFEL